MKVFLITKEPFPNGMAAVKRIVAYCKAWKKEDIDVEIVIYTRTERYGVEPKNTVGKGVYQSIPFRYIHNTPLRESSVFVRALNDRLDFFRLKKYLKRNLKNGDIIYTYGTNFKASALIDLAHKKGASYFQELCELPFGTSVETPKTIKNRKRYESEVLPKVDGIITISDALTDYARKHCSPAAHITKVPILVEYDRYNMEDRSEDCPVPYIFHSGTLFEQKDGFPSMLRAFGKIAHTLPFDIKFISTGTLSGSRHEDEINEIIREYNLSEKVIFTGYLSNEEVRDYLSKASFVVINKLPTQQNKYCFSTKLGEYMAAGKPVIITDVGEAMNWLTHGENSYIVPSGDIDALAQAMRELFLDKDLRHKLGTGANKACKEFFSIEANSRKLKKAIEFKS